MELPSSWGFPQDQRQYVTKSSIHRW